ncbi:hypothetical protein [Microbacterium sp. NPDC056052]|uniref:terminase small subunit n=1 Tax=Microbacterium sp. NPDC056052 TaxID=3345695 RepID=UPI0035D70039
MRVIVVAATKRDGMAEAKNLDIVPVAIVTPRAPDAARGVVGDRIMEASSLTPEMRDALMPGVLPSIVTTRGPVDMVAATEKAIEAGAAHLTDADAGAIEALRALARKIDAWDVIVDWALDDAAQAKGARPAVPQNDNVSISAYLKYCDQLGLSPVGRKALGVKDGGAGGKKAKLHALRGGKSA